MNAQLRLWTTLGCLVLAGLFAFAGASAAGVIETVAGTGQPDDGGESGDALRTNVGDPFGVEMGPDGALYITEVRNHRIRRLDLATGKLTTVAGAGKPGYSGDGGPATKARLNQPYEVRFDGQGNMFFVEMQNHIVRRVDAKSGRISTIAGTGEAGFGGDGGPAVQAQLQRPHSIALDEQGHLYIADIGNHRVRRVNLQSGTIDTIAGNGQRVLPEDGQRALGNPILGPRALFVQNTSMWIALREGHSIWRFDLSEGTLEHVAGTGKKGYSGDAQALEKATFNGPKGIVVDANGNVFVVDTENQAIRKLDVNNDLVTTIAGGGPEQRGGEGDGGPATEAQLNRPHGICLGAGDEVFIGDTLNHRVRCIRP